MRPANCIHLRRPFSAEPGACVELTPLQVPINYLMWMTVQVAVLLKWNPSSAPLPSDRVARSGLMAREGDAVGVSFRAPSKPFYLVFFVTPAEDVRGAREAGARCMHVRMEGVRRCWPTVCCSLTVDAPVGRARIDARAHCCAMHGLGVPAACPLLEIHP